MYRFFPAVRWKRGYPTRQEILREVDKIWKQYGLESLSHFDLHVDRVYQEESGRWVVNDPSMGLFEGVIAAVGTCGRPKLPHIEGVDRFEGQVYHSSELTGY